MRKISFFRGLVAIVIISTGLTSCSHRPKKSVNADTVRFSREWVYCEQKKAYLDTLPNGDIHQMMSRYVDTNFCKYVYQPEYIYKLNADSNRYYLCK